MNEMIDRVAKALFQRGNLMNMHEAGISARAAIAAMREPTPEMIEAGGDNENTILIWYAMIDKALK